MSGPQFTSSEHALIAGAVFGVLMKAGREGGIAWEAVPETVANPEDHRGYDYTPFITITSGGRTFRVIVAEVE